MLQDNRHAFSRYHALYNNEQYQILAHQIATDLKTTRESIQVSDILTGVSDFALSLCNHSVYIDVWLKLAIICGQNTLSTPTIDMMATYLQIFQQIGDTRVDDFQLTAKALLKTYQSDDSTKEAIACTNGIHGWQGRMAYHLLCASDFFQQSAIHLLIHGNLSYIREKLAYGIRQLSYALREGISHSEHPQYFDFSSDDFPPTLKR